MNQLPSNKLSSRKRMKFSKSNINIEPLAHRLKWKRESFSVNQLKTIPNKNHKIITHHPTNRFLTRKTKSCKRFKGWNKWERNVTKINKSSLNISSSHYQSRDSNISWLTTWFKNKIRGKFSTSHRKNEMGFKQLQIWQSKYLLTDLLLKGGLILVLGPQRNHNMSFYNRSLLM